MRDQYAGDISDLLKFAFLRTLAGEDRSLGICWYYNPVHDGRPDGAHREYLQAVSWKRLDPALFEALGRMPEPPSVSALEGLPIWPRARWFHRTPVPSGRHRREWWDGMRTAVQAADIIFVDPDNGVGKAGPRHAGFDEIALLRRPGLAIVLISFPGRHQKHGDQLSSWRSMLRAKTGTNSIVVLRTSVQVQAASGKDVPRSRWFTIIDPDALLIRRARDFAGKLNMLGVCKAWLEMEKENMSILSETPRDAILRLMGLLEKALTTRTSRMTFREQVEENRAVFSDVKEIFEARRVRNQIAHGEMVSDPKARAAKEALDRALSEVLGRGPDGPAIQRPEIRPQFPPEPARGPRAVSIPKCTWVYFATDSAADFTATKKTVSQMGMIIRTVYNSAGLAIANTKQIRIGDSILLVHGGGDRSLPYRPMFACEVVHPPQPVAGFNGFSFAETHHIPQLKNSNYSPDPHLAKYTGISVSTIADLETISALIPRPRGNNTIRKWDEVL